jgi:uncharacterized membrane protein YuzA (DUF378 family)
MMITNGGLIDVYEFETLLKITGFYTLCTTAGIYCIDYLFSYLKKKTKVH